MTGLVMFLHAAVAILMIVVILMQSGRGGGLTEGFASAESIFGAKTNEFMIKATTVLATVFLITCLGLAVLSAQKSKSLMSGETGSVVETPVADVVETAAQEVDAQVEALEDKVSTTLDTEVSAEAIPEEAPAVTTP